MARALLIGAQVMVTALCITFLADQNNTFWLSWLVPLILVFLVVINSFWVNRLTCWIIFAVSFFNFLVLLSAFTLRWRMEPGFDSHPFYRAIIMYIGFVYISLGQLKILGRSAAKS